MDEPQAAAAPPTPPEVHAEHERPGTGFAPLSLLRDVAISVVLAVILIVFISQPV